MTRQRAGKSSPMSSSSPDGSSRTRQSLHVKPLSAYEGRIRQQVVHRACVGPGSVAMVMTTFCGAVKSRSERGVQELEMFSA